MSNVQELLVMLVIALIMSFVFARVYKNEKLFSKLIITLVLGLVLGLTYCVVKEKMVQTDEPVTITSETTATVLNNDFWIDINPTCNLLASVVEKVNNAYPDYMSKDYVSITNHEKNESSGWKLRQLKIRCRGQTC